jgi:hypothetical protein
MSEERRANRIPSPIEDMAEMHPKIGWISGSCRPRGFSRETTSSYPRLNTQRSSTGDAQLVILDGGWTLAIA